MEGWVGIDTRSKALAVEGAIQPAAAASYTEATSAYKI